MDLRQLEAFAATLSSGSVTAAARLLGRSQPVISRQVQDLEADIGYPLFVRAGPRVTPTPEGFLLYEDVERALAGVRQLRARAGEIARGDGKPLRIAATPALSVGLVAPALGLATRDAGVAPVQWMTHSPERVIHAVVSGAVQLGVSSLPLEHRGVTIRWIGQAPCVAVLAEDDPLARQDVVTLAELTAQRQIAMSNPFRLRSRVDAALRNAGHSGTAGPGLIETNASVNAIAAVRAGLGVAILEPVTAHGFPASGIAVRPLDVDIPYFFGVVTPQGQPFCGAVAALSASLADAAAQLPGFVLHDAAAHASLLQSIHGGGQAAQESAP